MGMSMFFFYTFNDRLRLVYSFNDGFEKVEDIHKYLEEGALIRLLVTRDIVPTVTIGHCSGEIAAAFAAGYLSATEAIIIAYYPGFIVSKAPSGGSTKPQGSMMAVGLSELNAEKGIIANGLEKQLRVAYVNSPERVTIYGDNNGFESLLPILIQKGILARKLKTVGPAYHSRHMLRVGHKYEALRNKVLLFLGQSFRSQHSATFISSVAVGVNSSDFGSRYWRHSLESQLRWAQAIGFIQKTV
ncbi:acyl transferase/acyl hydrolase/lysophospholipase [Hypoxylon argillaceum]|nr:acyl transferase/acyl hydrolase/lysophospholipase [Hypoxylon argillaceum]